MVGRGGLTENGNHPIVGNLITSDIVKLYESNPSFSRGFDYRVYPTVGTIDISISQIPTLLHYSPIWGGGVGHYIYYQEGGSC